MDKLKIGLVIPVFNVEKAIGKVLHSITGARLNEIHEILIIDNNSTDNTLQIVQDFLRNYSQFIGHVSIMQHVQNYGYGCSVKAGFDYFLARDVSHILLIHGDYQVDSATLIKSQLEVIKQNPETDVVLASRFKPESGIDDYSMMRTFGNYFFNVITFICSGYRMSDAGTAMILARNSTLHNVPVRTLSNSWQFHPQLNILLHGIKNIRIQEVPMDWSDSDVASTLPIVRYGLTLLKMLIGYWFKKNILRQPPHMLFPSDPMPAYREFKMLDTKVVEHKVEQQIATY